MLDGILERLENLEKIYGKMIIAKPLENVGEKMWADEWKSHDCNVEYIE